MPTLSMQVSEVLKILFLLPEGILNKTTLNSANGESIS